MSWKVCRIKPKRIVKRNSLVLTPDMEVTVTTKQYQNSPFDNGAQEVKAMYMHIYGFDYQKACCTPNDFTYKPLA